MLVLALRGPDPMPLSWPRLLGSLAIGTGLYGLVTVIGPSLEGIGYAFDVAVVVAYPLLTLGTRVVPSSILRPAASASRASLPGRRTSAAVYERLRGLDAVHLDLLDRVVRRREPLAAHADAIGESEAVVSMRLVVALRRLSDLPPGPPLKAEIARYVVEDLSVVRHADLGRELIDDGVDPFVLDAIYQAAVAVRAVPSTSLAHCAGRCRPADAVVRSSTRRESAPPLEPRTAPRVAPARGSTRGHQPPRRRVPPASHLLAPPAPAQPRVPRPPGHSTRRSSRRHAHRTSEAISGRSLTTTGTPAARYSNSLFGSAKRWFSQVSCSSETPTSASAV